MAVSLTVDAACMIFEAITEPSKRRESDDIDTVMLLVADDDQVMICGTEEELVAMADSIYMCVTMNRLKREGVIT